MNGVQLNGVLNGVHLFLNAELNAPNISELNPELNARQNFAERQLNAAFRISVQYTPSFRVVFDIFWTNIALKTFGLGFITPFFGQNTPF